MATCATLVFVITSILASHRLYASAGNIPRYLSVCKRSSPDLPKCLINAANKAKAFVGKGIRELGFPPLAPFILHQINLEQGTQAISYRVNLTNITVFGLDNYLFRDLSFDPVDFTLRGTILLNKLNVTANYDVQGKILFAPIKGVGVLSVNTGPTNVSFELPGEMSQDGKHIIPTNVNVEIEVASGDGHFEGIINDNEELSQVTNRILNDNSEALLKDSLPELEQISGEVLLQIWGTINKLIPYDKLLPST